MLNNVHTVYYHSDLDQLSDQVLHCTQKSVDEQLIKHVKNHLNPSGPVVFVHAQAHLPPHWQQRLCQPLFEDEQILVVSALTPETEHLSPIINDFEGDLAELDQAVFLLQSPQYFMTDALNPHCFVVKDLDHVNSTAIRFAVNNLVVAVPSQKASIQAPKATNIGDQRPLPAHPLAELRQALTIGDFSQQTPTGYPQLDQKPVVLHVLMDWGGGVHQWVNDFIQMHQDMHHLVLISVGEFYRNLHGEKFVLRWGGTEGLVVAEHHLSQSIQATQVHHPEYQAMLDHFLNRWHVQHLVVSSVIGHALDCFNTGLPTLRVLHDYFPHWPSLNALLDKPVISQQDIESALAQTAEEPFGSIRADQLQQWQHASNELLSQANITLVAPDESVKTNLLKLPASDCYQNCEVIPHASEPLNAIDYQPSGEPFTVLVLGRLTAAKGLGLMTELIDHYGQDSGIHFVLLGAGKNGEQLADANNTTVIENYALGELVTITQSHSPQMALIPSLTAETFNYTLSELWRMGLPVLATEVGALANRIDSGQNGLLVKPEVDQLVAAIERLRQSPDELIQLHQAALATPLMTRDENCHAYAQLLNLKATKTDNYHTKGLVTPSVLADRLKRFSQKVIQYRQSLDQAESDIQEKTKWATELDQHNQHLANNIKLERENSQRLERTIQQQLRVLEEMDTIKRQNEVLQDQNNQLNTAFSQAQKDIEVLDGDRQKLNHQLTEMLNSRSWRFTRPLRRFTTYARHKRNAIKFRFNQLKSLPKRVTNSLKTRGLKQTALMAKNKLKKPAPPAAITAQAMDQTFEAFKINCSDSPEVSVIIPVYNHFEHTYHCLQSLARLADQTAFEVIVVDDCSTDQTPEAIKNIEGTTYHRQTVNGGFIESCNTGAKLAQAEYLVFLNNDTEVLDGWLDELLATFTQQPQAGLVGSQLLYPDGRLQEAGGIVFSDASGWNYGRLDNPDAPEYQHLREATYISGASIMISRKLFNELGRFDERYKPAYYEDTDLAFAVRAAGLKVYYQPLSRVIHFEGISSGTDLNSGTKKYQVINQQKFLDKWQSALTQQPKPGTDIELARMQGQPPRVLILDACTPTPDQDSGSLRMMNLMQIFIELGYHVSFIPENMAHFDAYTQQLQRLGVECIYAPKYSSPIEFLQHKGKYFERVILSRYYVADPVMGMIRSYCPDADIWFDTVDLHYLRETRMAEVDQDEAALKTAQNTKLKEYAVARDCDLTLVVSPYEQQVMHQEDPSIDVAVLSNIHAIYGGHVGYTKSQDIMFIGGYQHTPNVDGILWFVNDILPLICERIPTIKLHIIGSKAPQQVVDLGQNPHVEFHGFVADIEPMMQQIRLAVAPLRFGAGVKGKVNMSMSYGQPVVGTSVAVEGMYTTHGKDVMMADEAEAFAEAVIKIYQDQSLWEQVSAGGLENVEKWFSFNAAKNTIAKLLSRKQLD